MGRTYRGTRKQFGARKTQQHRARSKWKAQNGTRLRTLNVDLVEFMEHSEFGESLHRPHEKLLIVKENVRLRSKEDFRTLVEAEERAIKTEGRSGVRLPTVEPYKPKLLEPHKPKLPTVEPYKPKLLEPVRRLVDLYDAHTFLNGLSTEILRAKKSHASRQVSHITKLVAAIQRDLDDSFKTVIQRLIERRKYWDRQVGIIGPILVERQT